MDWSHGGSRYLPAGGGPVAARAGLPAVLVLYPEIYLLTSAKRLRCRRHLADLKDGSGVGAVAGGRLGLGRPNPAGRSARWNVAAPCRAVPCRSSPECCGLASVTCTATIIAV